MNHLTMAYHLYGKKSILTLGTKPLLSKLILYVFLGSISVPAAQLPWPTPADDWQKTAPELT